VLVSTVPTTEKRKHMRVEAKLEGLGLTLPEAPKPDGEKRAYR